jgi:hypothetical protein
VAAGEDAEVAVAGFAAVADAASAVAAAGWLCAYAGTPHAAVSATSAQTIRWMASVKPRSFIALLSCQ